VAVIGQSFVSIVVFAATFLASYWLLFVQIFPEDLPWLATGAAFSTGGALAGLIWRGMQAERPGVFGTVMAWAGSVGGVGFCGGFFGPMALTQKPIRGRCSGFSLQVPWDWPRAL
jgi:hypothetical protein